MTEHTPGPWRLHQWSKAAGNPGVYSRVSANRDDAGDIDVCRFDLFPDADDEHEANAKLIAAAPDMLESLQATLKYLECYASPEANELWSKVGEAIAKATGVIR